MRPFSIDQLRVLANAYCAATGVSVSALGEKVSDNHKLFRRLLNGADCTYRNAEQASVWFAENWPADVPWPEGVPAERAE